MNVLRFFLFLAICSALNICKAEEVQDVKKIVVVGASITEGYGTEDPARFSFPAQLAGLLGEGYSVLNCGVGGTTMLKNGDYPYWTKGKLSQAVSSHPDIVIIDLGGNDSKAVNRVYMNEFINDACDMVAVFRNLDTHPRIILLTPIVSFYAYEDGIWDPCIINDVTPAVLKAAEIAGVEVIDMHPVLYNNPELMPDGVHPDNEGSLRMARRIYDFLSVDRK